MNKWNRLRRGAGTQLLLFVGLWMGIAAPGAHAAEPGRLDLARLLRGKPSVLPDHGGAIAEILVYFTEDHDEGFTPLLRDLFNKMPSDVRFVVACPNHAEVQRFERTLGAAARAGGRQIRVYSLGVDISVWARDRVIARQFPNGRPAPYLVPLPSPDSEEWRLNEHYAPFALEAAGGLPEVQAAPLRIEGGNLLATRNRVIIGVNALVENADLLDDWPERLQLNQRMQDLFGKPVLLIGEDEATLPWDHVDMYITPISAQGVLVADPALGAELLDLPLTRDTTLCEDDPDCICASPEEAELFDAAAEQLASAGFSVHRLPALVNRADGWMITYNNVLIDEREGKKTVFMPVYGVAALDEEATHIYRRLGYTVATVDVSGVFEEGGAVRCVANVLQRRRSPALRTARVAPAEPPAVRTR